MCWVTVIWSMVASACLTLAAVHLLVWCRARAKWGYLLFSLAASAAAAAAGCELWMIRAQTPAEYITALRWLHVPLWAIVVTTVGFVRFHLRAGRPWLGWSVCGLRTVSLLLNVLMAQGLNFREVTRLRPIRFLGEVVPVPEGVANPWMLVGQLSLAALVVFVVDAGVTVWRRRDGLPALLTTGSIVFFVTIGAGQAVLAVSGTAPWPHSISVLFLGVLLAMANELARDAVRSAHLADELRESEARYRGLFDGAVEGVFRTSPDGRVLVANPALARMLGYASAADLIATVTDLGAQVWVDPAERSRLLQQVEAQGAVRGCECLFRRKDGTQLWVSLSGQAARGPDGRLAHIDGFLEDITDRRQTRDALLASEARLASAVEAAGLGFYESVEGGRLSFQDERVRELLGIPPGEESRGREYWLSRVHPEDLPGVVQKSQGIIAGGLSQVDAEYRYRHPTRGLIWVHHWSRVMARDAAGRVVRLLGVIQDITERKEAEVALARVSHQNEQILRTAAEGIIGLDPQGRHAFANPAAARMLGYAPEELLGHDSHSLWHHSRAQGEPYPKSECPICLAYTQGKAQQAAVDVFWRKDGTSFPVQFKCAPVGGQEGALGAVITFEDITVRVQADQALRTSQARLASGADLAGLGFYESTEGAGEGVTYIGVTYIDDRARAICGFPPEAASGAPASRFWREHIHPDDLPRILGLQQRLIDTGLERVSTEYRYLHPDHGERWIHHLAIVAARGGSGQPVRLTGVVRDITEHRQAERELAQQRLQLAHVARVSSMGQLASSLAHELNQPLGAILRNAEAAELLLAESSPDLDELRAILADIRSDDHRAGEVIDRMRALIKHRGIAREPLDLSRLVGEVIALLRPDADIRGVRLDLERDPTAPAVDGDRVQLQQVLLNLLLNAMDAVEGRPRGERRVSVQVRTQGVTVEVNVSDNGPGIRPEMLARIFEPFCTTKPNGLGMGLPIARTIVEAHGGRLRAENRPAGGAVFTFSLPVKGGSEQ